jgi:hypothetical protein
LDSAETVLGGAVMAEAAVTADTLRSRLVRAGQPAPDNEDTPCATDVWPTPEAIVTVAMNLDPTLMPAYRRRYFACCLKSEVEPVPALRDEPAFALPEVARMIATEDQAEDRFLGGPFRWFLRRIMRFDSVLLWPACREPDSGGAFPQADLQGAPLLRAKLPPDSSGLAGLGAVTLDLRREPDWRVIWEVATWVSHSFSDFFVSDVECKEVYHLHHHGKVIASLPDHDSRQDLIEDLATWSDLIEDCSGYVSDWDDEDDDQA